MNQITPEAVLKAVIEGLEAAASLARENPTHWTNDDVAELLEYIASGYQNALDLMYEEK